MPTVQERFAAAAEDAPRSPTPPGIWAEGRRRARVRRIGTGVVVAATFLLATAVGGLALHRESGPRYASTPGARPAIPATIHEPSEWLGTDSTPPGRLSVVIPTKKRSWFGYRWGLVGVSATSGTYGFLALPGYGSVGALSPDGRHYAYWLGHGPNHHQVLYGLAIYDTTTGHVARWVPSAREGFDPNGLAWNGNDALTFVRKLTGTSAERGYLWRLGQAAPRPIKERLSWLVGSAGQAGLYARDHLGRSLFYLDPRHGRALRTVTIAKQGPRLASEAAVSPSGRMVAAVHLGERHSSLLVGRVGPGPVALAAVPADLHWPRPLAWTDDDHLLVVDQVSPTGFFASGDAEARYAVVRVDVTSGRTTVVAPVGSMGDGWVDFASDLFATPTRPFPAPPRPWDPRVEAGLGVAVVLLGGIALVLWRRHARA